MTGVELIAEERVRQVAEEGWSNEHDDTHDEGQLAKAAAAYLAPTYGFDPRTNKAPEVWPWDWKWWKSKLDYKWLGVGRRLVTVAGKRDERIRDLVKAGALVAAEIDRLQRLPARG